MERDRSWRRWRGEVKLSRIYHHHAHMSYKYLRSNFWHHGLTYYRQTGIGERIEVTAIGDAQYDQYVRHKAKLLRDNPKACNCQNCCNTRNMGLGNAIKKVLHISEQRALEDSHNQMAFEESISTSTWRSRKVNTIHYEHGDYDKLRFQRKHRP